MLAEPKDNWRGRVACTVGRYDYGSAHVALPHGHITFRPDRTECGVGRARCGPDTLNTEIYGCGEAASGYAAKLADARPGRPHAHRSVRIDCAPGRICSAGVRFDCKLGRVRCVSFQLRYGSGRSRCGGDRVHITGGRYDCASGRRAREPAESGARGSGLDASSDNSAAQVATSIAKQKRIAATHSQT